MMGTTLRSLGMTLLALAVMGLAATATAGSKKGVGWLQSVDVAAGSVMINDLVISVTEDSRLSAKGGDRMRLSDFQAGVAGPAPGIMSIDDADRVEFDAREENGMLVMYSMRQLSRGPE